PVAALLEELAAAACRDLALERDAVTVERLVDVRYVGQAHELTVELPDGPIDAQAVAGLRDRFHERYVAAYGSTIGGPIELVSFRARVTSPVAGPIDGGEIVSPAVADLVGRAGLRFVQPERPERGCQWLVQVVHAYGHIRVVTVGGRKRCRASGKRGRVGPVLQRDSGEGVRSHLANGGRPHAVGEFFG